MISNYTRFSEPAYFYNPPGALILENILLIIFSTGAQLCGNMFN